MDIIPLWKGLGTKVGFFLKIKEILDLIDNKIFQFDLFEGEKIVKKLAIQPSKSPTFFWNIVAGNC